MNKIVHDIGLDVHKDLRRLGGSAEKNARRRRPQGTTEVRRYGIIGGTLDAVDKLVKKPAHEPECDRPRSQQRWKLPECFKPCAMGE